MPPVRRDGLLEVVDADNRPLCLLREAEALRQRLAHRAVALLVRDRRGRALLAWRPWGWGFSSFRRLTAGCAAAWQAGDLLLAEWQQHGRVLPLGILPPESRLHAFAYLFEARVSAACAAMAARDTERFLLADYDELRGLNAGFGDMLSPLLRAAVAAGLVRPR